MKTNATFFQLEQALNLVNKDFDNNIKFKRLETISPKRNLFTLDVISSKEKGASRSNHGTRIHAACWHVHGKFFDYLFEIDSNIYVISLGQKITENEGNWKDYRKGYDFWASMGCDC